MGAGERPGDSGVSGGSGATGKTRDTGELTDQSAVRSLRLGDVTLTYAVDGAMGLPVERFFPALPAGYWAAHRGLLDARGRVAMSVGGLLVERAGRALLIDAGLGPVAGEHVYGQVDAGSLPATLTALGRPAAEIDTLAFTHLHSDHTGWSFVPDGAGGFQPAFPAARYLLAADEWWPHERGEPILGAPGRREVIEPLAGIRELVEDGDEVFPGVRALVTPGHSPGHTSYVISASGGGRLVAFGDAFHIPAQLAHPEWPSAPDVDTAAVLAARSRLVAELEQPGTLGFGCHFGDQVFGRLVRDRALRPHWEPVPAPALLPAPRQLAA